MSTEEKVALVHNFISSEFAGFAIDRREELDRYRFELRKDNSRHLILVQKAFLDAFELPDIEMQLRNSSVGMVARSLGDFPVVVTTNGCIFDRDVL